MFFSIKSTLTSSKEEAKSENPDDLQISPDSRRG